MRILLDNNVPRQIRRSLRGHSVQTAKEAGLALLTNGDLLVAAEEAGYELLITEDQNISYQQNLSGRTIALVVLDETNWLILSRHPERIHWPWPPLPATFQRVSLLPEA